MRAGTTEVCSVALDSLDSFEPALAWMTWPTPTHSSRLMRDNRASNIEEPYTRPVCYLQSKLHPPLCYIPLYSPDRRILSPIQRRDAMRILIMSASRPAAIALARVLASRGHSVFAADTEPIWGTSPARLSRAYTRFYRLRSTSELDASILEDIDIWIPFEHVPDNMEELCKHHENKTVIWAPLFDREEVFQDFVRERITAKEHRNSVVSVPMAFDVSSIEQVFALQNVLHSKRFAVTLSPYEEHAAIADEEENEAIEDDEDTLVEDVEAAKKLSSHPYRVTEIMQDGFLVQTHCLIINGAIRIFTITTAQSAVGSEAARDWVAVAPAETLHEALYEFTWNFVAVYEEYEAEREKDVQMWDEDLGPTKRLSTHMTLTFHVKDEIIESQLIRRMTAISCDNIPHESLLILISLDALHDSLNTAYTAEHHLADGPIILSADLPHAKGIYSCPDLVSEMCRMIRNCDVWSREWWLGFANFFMMVLVWGLWFREEMWCWWDPGPAVAVWVIRPLAEHMIKTWKRSRVGRGVARVVC